MTQGIRIRKAGLAGRITLQRPEALNALTYPMVKAIEAALDTWRNDASIAMLIIDAEGDRAFCAGGDIAEMFTTASDGEYAYGRQFWRDEYRMNAKLFDFPKPVVTFLQGFTMGGGVGIGCHGSHRIVDDGSRIAMPECSIGLIPDVGGSLLLARAPGRLGEYLGTTGARMGPGDAIHAGFADYYIPSAGWPGLIRQLEETSDWTLIDEAALPPPGSPMAAHQVRIDDCFDGETLRDCLTNLRHMGGDFAAETLDLMARNAPLSMACTIELVHRARARDDIAEALGQEFRFVWRAIEQGDFIEGIRARIIDKDNRPRWHHPDPDAPSASEVARMLMPLGEDALKLEKHA